jgi:hypothetical protein
MTASPYVSALCLIKNYILCQEGKIRACDLGKIGGRAEPDTVPGRGSQNRARQLDILLRAVAGLLWSKLVLES